MTRVVITKKEYEYPIHMRKNNAELNAALDRFSFQRELPLDQQQG